MKQTLGVLGKLLDLFLLGFLVWKVISVDTQAAQGAWMAATFAYMTFILAERILERLANPVYSVYIDQMGVDDAAQVMEKAFAQDPFKKG